MRLLALALLLPFLAFAAVKPGTMLAADAQGRIMVTLCGDHAPVEMAVGLDGTLTPVSDLGHDPAPAKAPCGWGLHGQPLVLAPDMALPPPAQAAPRLAQAPVPDAPVPVSAPAARWPRGPPAA